MEKIKPIIKYCLETDKGKDILVIIIIILMGLGSFGLGRLSKSNTKTGVKIEYSDKIQKDQEANVLGLLDEDLTELSSNSNSGNYFASNRGSKYYSLGCAGGKTIKQENRVYFNTKEEAEKAGYELSSSCK